MLLLPEYALDLNFCFWVVIDLSISSKFKDYNVLKAFWKSTIIFYSFNFLAKLLLFYVDGLEFFFVIHGVM